MNPPSDPILRHLRYGFGNRPPLGDAHQKLMDDCYRAQEVYAAAADGWDPFRGADCWIVNKATQAQIAAVAFCEWNYQVHNGGIDQFFGNLHGYAFYFIDAMMRVLDRHGADPIAQDLRIILNDTVAAISPHVGHPAHSLSAEWAAQWRAPEEFARCRTSPQGLRIPIDETRCVEVEGREALNNRFFAMDDGELIARMNGWLAEYAAAS